MLCHCKSASVKNWKTTANDFTADWKSMNYVNAISIKRFKTRNAAIPPGWSNVATIVLKNNYNFLNCFHFAFLVHSESKDIAKKSS